ncbi:lasso peptide biosynthesis B2 protein [uncultured Tolumonas sp.]|uniref:lasso peptide biosynthesis B2 protein n=1 Tax=uncultured Tolumonas sp. TaxID=263765 RepID=UPI00292EAA49|nr:lasso peptide biosynthesis B2 protein [uncultured Tolumonas sp.]
MRRFLTRLWRFLCLPRAEQYQIIVITLLLAKMRLKTKYQPSQRLFQFSPFDASITSRNQTDIKQIIKRIQQIAALVWWRALCLEQALTLSVFLTRQQRAHTLFIGVKRDQQNTFAAHAWVSIEREVVLGGPVDDYQIIATYPRGSTNLPDETTPLDIDHS